jgi:threonine dehydrogenase-like Zn-dependent dehydrogenase
VTALARYPQQVAMARELGAEEVLTDGDLYEQVARITGAKHYTFPLNPGMLLGGFDVIYDCVGNEKTLLNALRWARAGGVVVMVGVKLASVKIDLNPIWYQEVDLIGSAFFGMDDWQGERVHTFDIVIEQLQKGVLTCKGLITHRFPFEEYKRAVAAASDKSTGSIKVVFEY